MKKVAIYLFVLIVGLVIGINSDSLIELFGGSNSLTTNYTKLDLPVKTAKESVKKYVKVVDTNAPAALTLNKQLLNELTKIANTSNGVRLYWTSSGVKSANDFNGFVAVATTAEGGEKLLPGKVVSMFILNNNNQVGICPPTCDLSSSIYVPIPIKEKSVLSNEAPAVSTTESIQDSTDSSNNEIDQ